MEYLLRRKGVITGEDNLEPLFTFKNFPIFAGCADHGETEDIKADMNWAICPKTGMIQLDKLIPLEILYKGRHFDGTGPTWQQYYQDFAEYIWKQNPGNILEIGGGLGQLAETFMKTTGRNNPWTIIEPNPLHAGDKNIQIIQGFFGEDFRCDGKADSIVLSHVLEHIYDPQVFLQSLEDYLKPGGKVILAYPNLELWLSRKYTNAIGFEHSIFLTDYFLDYLFLKHGFSIIDKYYYKDHSIFYTVQKEKRPVQTPRFENKYHEYKKIFSDFISYHEVLINDLNSKIERFNGPVYLFGAHVFSQHLLHFGLNQKRVMGLLDNSKLKQGRRLYGYQFYVEAPESLRNKNKVAVVLKAGIYQDEILNQLRSINNQIIIFS